MKSRIDHFTMGAFLLKKKKKPMQPKICLLPRGSSVRDIEILYTLSKM